MKEEEPQTPIMLLTKNIINLTEEIKPEFVVWALSGVESL
jgi:hypothetical protein